MLLDLVVNWLKISVGARTLGQNDAIVKKETAQKSGFFSNLRLSWLLRAYLRVCHPIHDKPPPGSIAFLDCSCVPLCES